MQEKARQDRKECVYYFQFNSSLISIYIYIYMCIALVKVNNSSVRPFTYAYKLTFEYMSTMTLYFAVDKTSAALHVPLLFACLTSKQ